MSQRQAIMEQLIRSKNQAVERTIELVFAHGTLDEQRELAEVLLKRNNRAGWVALIRSFDRLDDSIKAWLVERPKDLFGPLSESMQNSTGPARENVIRIVRHCAEVRLVYLLAESLMDSRTDVRELAGKSLLEAVHRYHAQRLERMTGEIEHDPEEVVQLRRAIDFSLRQYRTHRQASAVNAALIFERQQDSQTWAYFQDTYDDLTRCATTILRAPKDPALAAATLLALGSPLKPAAMAGVSGAEEPELCQALASESYRLIDPVLREVAAGIPHLKMMASTKREAAWNGANWTAWLRMIDCVGLPATQRLVWLQKMLEQACAEPEMTAWRLAIMRSLAETGLPEAFKTILPLGTDPDERVARCAARYLLSRRQANWREHAAVLLKSPHLSVRRMVSMDSTGNEDFGKLWHEYPKLPPAVQYSAARETSANDEQFITQLKAKLASAQVADVAQGLKMAGGLLDVSAYRGQLIALCGHAAPRISSLAVKLIGRLDDPKLRDLLEAAAHHADPRVRANAVESMESLHIADRSQEVLKMINSRHNRERANAIKAISQFDFSTARECLAKMLGDSNPLHRISALWVVNELNLLEIVRQTNSMARRDPNARVRKRASEMLDSINAPLNISAGEGDS